MDHPLLKLPPLADITRDVAEYPQVIDTAHHQIDGETRAIHADPADAFAQAMAEAVLSKLLIALAGGVPVRAVEILEPPVDGPQGCALPTANHFGCQIVVEILAVDPERGNRKVLLQVAETHPQKSRPEGRHCHS
jgi:hypothetical protein